MIDFGNLGMKDALKSAKRLTCLLVAVSLSSRKLTRSFKRLFVFPF